MNETAPKPPRRRRWRTFSLLGMLLATTLIACLFALVAAVKTERHRCEKQIQAHHRLIDPRNLSAGTQLKLDEAIPMRSGVWEKIWGLNYFDRLTEIEIRSRQHEKIPVYRMQTLKHFPNLKTLKLDTRVVERSGFSELTHLHNLEKLILDRSYITDAELASIRDLKKLSYLDLRYTRLTDEGIAHLVNLGKLKTLLLTRSKITDKTIPNLVELTSLEELDLSETAISPDAAAELSKLANLRKLTLSTTNFPTPAQDSLRDRLPNCEIVFKE